MKTKFFSMLLLASFAISCGGGKEATQDIIQENVEFAKAQLAHLIDAAEAGDTLQIPSSYKNGKIEFVPTDDWVSGFFAGTLWYMYELTGDEFYAQKAQKHTEISPYLRALCRNQGCYSDGGHYHNCHIP